MPGYRQDLAYIHDAGFGGFARGVAPQLLRILAESGVDSGQVVDLGCGSGIWAGALRRAGFQVLGVDSSPAMIELARRRAPGAQFQVGSLWSTDLPFCDAVTALGECLNYRWRESRGRRDLSVLFRRVYRALRPGGVFLIDLAEPGRGRGPRLRHWQGSDWAILVEVEEDTRRRRLTRHITAFRKIGGSYPRSRERHELQLYPAAEVATVLRRAGFRVRVRRAFGTFRLAPGQAALLARKST